MYPEFCWRNLLENSHLGGQKGNWRLTLRWMLGRWVVRFAGGWKWLRIGSSKGIGD